MKSIGRKTFDGDCTLVRCLQYDHTSLWWFIEATFWRFHVRKAIRYAGTLMHIIDGEKPSRIVIVKDDSLLANVAISIGE